MSQLIRFQSDKKLAAHMDWVSGCLDKGYHYPVTIEIDPTNRCPLDCPYCIWHELRHSDAAKATIAPDVLLRVVREAAEIGVKSLVWTGGGEPLANPGTVAAIKLAHELGIKNGMFTTAVPMTPAVAEVLLECLTWVRFHIDGATPETYARYHLVAGKVMAKVVENIRHFTARRAETSSTVSAGIGTVAIMENIGEIPALAALAKDLGLDFFQYKHDLTLMSEQAHLEWWKTDAIPMMRRLSRDLEDSRFALQFTEGIDYTDPDRSDACHVHSLNTAIAATGHVAYCKRLRDRPDWALGNVNEQSLKAIFDGARHAALRQEVTPATCGILPCPHKQANIRIHEVMTAGDLSLIDTSGERSEHWEFI